MAYVALIAWIVTAIMGLFLLTIWLIEYDPDYQRAAATRLPIPVLFGHVLFAVGGLGSWIVYLITDKKVFCWASAGALAVIATLGFTMAIRWLGVYRARPDKASAPSRPVQYATGPEPAGGAAGHAGTTGPRGRFSGHADPGELAIPPERHFPVPVVIAHGLFAVTTVIVVVLIVLGGGS
jgi:hypothetical protein